MSEKVDEVNVDELKADKTKVNMCPSCGGKMNFDPEMGMLKCQYCNTTKEIDYQQGETVENPFKEAISEGVRSWSEDDIQTVVCKNCGAQIVFDKYSRAQFCNYCGSSHVSVQAPEQIIPPGYVVPFAVSEKKAGEAFKLWIGKRWFAPNKLKSSFKNNRLLGTYIPYWTFDTQTFNRYTAERGDYYYVTKTRTVNGKTETYQERHTRWTSVSGNYERFFDDVLVSASNKVDTHILNKVDDFNLGGLVSYKPDFLSGFFAEKYSVPLDEGWTEGKSIVDQTLSNEITRRIGGDEVRFLNISTHYDDIMFKHILLPVWISSYLFGEKSYNFMINGQTGAVQGAYPKSWIKITLAIIAGLIAVGLIYILISSQ
ncbi:TFIIB-type zinc ribbon-containing protein [Fusibacter bizertensis]